MPRSESETGEVASELLDLLRDADLSDAELGARLADVNPIDVARAMSHLEEEEVARVFDLLGEPGQTTVLAEADARAQAFLLLHVGERGSELVAGLEPDDAADVLEALEEPQREELLQQLPESDAREIRELSSYEPDTAGGLMTSEVASVPPEQTAQEVLAWLRTQAEELENISNIYVVAGRRLVGVFSLRDLIRAEPDTMARDIMVTDVITIEATQDREDVVRVMETYHLSTLPVVDEGHHLVGIVTFDDALTAMEEEGSEDVMTIAGHGATEVFPTQQRVRERVRARLPWLIVTLGGGFGCALIVKVLHDLPADPPEGDARFYNMIAGLAGSVAVQSAAVMVRGFATGEIVRGGMRRVIAEEMRVGGIIGILVGLGVAGILFLMGTPPAMLWSVAISLAVASTVASGVGTLIPSLCQRLDVDPAISAGPFLTALNDLLGLSTFILVGIGFNAWLS